MLNKLFIFVLLLWSPALFPQGYIIHGMVNDSLTREPLAFVNIVMNDGKHGGVTDIDGRFRLLSEEPVRKLSFSYVGYQPLSTLVNQEDESLRILMSKLEVELSEVLIVAGENPAHRIIRSAVEMRDINNPANIKSFAYTSYDKMIFTINTDSLRKSDTTPVDSADIRLLRIVERQHLFMMESVAEHKFLFPGRHHDKIIATRISGLKDPLFVFLISQMQSASFYDDPINIIGTNYMNPVSPGSENRYFFALQDTMYGLQAEDTTYIISFKPRPDRNFDGMKGLLYINNHLWAIKNVIAEPARPDESFEMRIQQMYDLIDGKQWFPVQLNTDITFNNIKLNKSRPVGIGKSYRRDIQLGAEVVKRDIANIAVEVTPEASQQDDAFWGRYRIDSLTSRELNTYRVIDSLGKANRFDARVKGFTALVSGQLPMGYLELDLKRLFRYSQYEGFYAGVGLHSSDKFSRFIKFGGYIGYGFRDQEIKYGYDLLFRFHRYNHLTLGVRYAYDLEEAAGTRFFDDDLAAFTPSTYRNFYISRMDRTETAEAMLRFRMLRYVQAGVGIAQSRKRAAYDYAWLASDSDPAVLTSDHTFGKILAGLRFAYGEKLIQNAHSQASLGTSFPVLWLQYTGSRHGFLDGQFNYNRADIKLKYSFYTRFIGKTTVILTGGAIDNPAPYSELLNGYGSLGEKFPVYSPAGFATMRAEEFLNDRFGAIFITHSFGKLLYRSGFFEPELALAFNAGVGRLKEPWRHRYADFKTMEKGYYEGGILIDNLLKSSFSGIGLAVFYRAGPYSYSSPGKNLAVKLTINYAL